MVLEGRRISIEGVVQGVGFRPWVARLARRTGIAGRVRNGSSGVTIEAFGALPQLEAFQGALKRSRPRAAAVHRMSVEPIPGQAVQSFVIEPSRDDPERRVSIPPDLPTCEVCLGEMADPSNRRFRYPFINCTQCGPRYTITRDVPYDRARTTMAAFEMCSECRAEYQAIEDRRYHAEPIACPRCGPRLVLLGPDGGDRQAADPIRAAGRRLIAGAIVAVKGLGGFHLAVDATRRATVRRLRRLKRRDQKPFAVMVRDLATAERLAFVGPVERKLLVSCERPVVLLRARPGIPITSEVAPGLGSVGLMLPYTPLHHLLLAEVDRPLVMTSGNLSDEPLAFQDDDARDRLGPIAGLTLTHDREIAARCDDSVARVIGEEVTVMRRARGYVPRPLALARPFERPVLACGAHLKNTFCIGVGAFAHLGPHVGDLETEAACRAFEEAVERTERFLDVRPEVIAHDLHPDYFSTLYARRRPEVVKVAVQHHHAHCVSAMAEHGLIGPVLGVAYDGTGYGTDGTAWGGELLLASYASFRRLASLRPIPLPGGDRAVKEVWRTALALLEEAFDGEPPLEALTLFRGIPEREVAVVRQMLARELNAPLARGVGRYFDAFGAIALDARRSDYEGQVAIRLNEIAEPAEQGRYEFAIDRKNDPVELDLRWAFRQAVDQRLAGIAPGVISARFHNTLIEATAQIVRDAAAQHGRLPVVLTGGCFQNPRLAEGVQRALEPRLEVFRHGEVPPGDGGIALGQALVADAQTRESAPGPAEV